MSSSCNETDKYENTNTKYEVEDQIEKWVPYITSEKSKMQKWVFNKRHYSLRNQKKKDYCEKSEDEDFTDNKEMVYNREPYSASNKEKVASRTKGIQRKMCEFKTPEYKPKKMDLRTFIQKTNPSLRHYRIPRKDNGNDRNMEAVNESKYTITFINPETQKNMIVTAKKKSVPLHFDEENENVVDGEVDSVITFKTIHEGNQGYQGFTESASSSSKYFFI